jgi:hypothetical protein
MQAVKMTARQQNRCEHSGVRGNFEFILRMTDLFVRAVRCYKLLGWRLSYFSALRGYGGMFMFRLGMVGCAIQATASAVGDWAIVHTITFRMVHSLRVGWRCGWQLNPILWESQLVTKVSTWETHPGKQKNIFLDLLRVVTSHLDVS